MLVFGEGAPGYEAKSYGGMDLVLQVMDEATNTATHGDGERTLPKILQKVVKWQWWDATGALLFGGAHMPLLFFIGNQSRRSDTSIVRRDQRAEITLLVWVLPPVRRPGPTAREAAQAHPRWRSAVAEYGRLRFSRISDRQ